MRRPLAYWAAKSGRVGDGGQVTLGRRRALDLGDDGDARVVAQQADGVDGAPAGSPRRP